MEFGESEIPLYLEIASNNHMFIGTAEDNEDGTTLRVYRAEFGFATSPGGCSNTSVARIQLGTDLEIPDLEADDAIGIALAATDHNSDPGFPFPPPTSSLRPTISATTE